MRKQKPPCRYIVDSFPNVLDSSLSILRADANELVSKEMIFDTSEVNASESSSSMKTKGQRLSADESAVPDSRSPSEHEVENKELTLMDASDTFAKSQEFVDKTQRRCYNSEEMATLAVVFPPWYISTTVSGHTL